MIDITVYGIPGSPYVRSVLLGLEEKGIPYRVSPVGFEGNKQHPHLDRHPFGRVPAFEHDGFMLYETQAILRYIDAVVPSPSLQPSDPRTAARMNQLVGIIDCYLFHQVGVPIAYQRIIRPMMGEEPDESVIVKAMPQAAVCYREIARLAQGNVYLTGSQLTIADLMLAAHLSLLGKAPEGRTLIGAHPELVAWLERMEARPSMRRTADPRNWARAA